MKRLFSCFPERMKERRYNMVGEAECRLKIKESSRQTSHKTSVFFYILMSATANRPINVNYRDPGTCCLWNPLCNCEPALWTVNLTKSCSPPAAILSDYLWDVPPGVFDLAFHSSFFLGCPNSFFFFKLSPASKFKVSLAFSKIK